MNTLKFLVEIRKAQEEIRKAQEELSRGIEKIYILTDGKKVVDKDIWSMIVHKEQAIKVGITNSDLNQTAKNIEVGFRVPKQIIVNKKNLDSLFVDDDTGEQIARFHYESLHGNTTSFFGDLLLKPNVAGEYTIRCFIKGDNIQTKYLDVQITVNQELSS